MRNLTARLKRDIYRYSKGFSGFNSYVSYEGFIQHVRRCCDMRTKVDRAYFDFVKGNEDVKLVNFQEFRKEIYEKRNSRRKNSWIFVPIFQNPFVKDYMTNKKYLSKVFSDHLNFSHSRNHWAKNLTDYNLLSILLRKSENQF
jgi:hypothetical protein